MGAFKTAFAESDLSMTVQSNMFSNIVQQVSCHQHSCGGRRLNCLPALLLYATNLVVTKHTPAHQRLGLL